MDNIERFTPAFVAWISLQPKLLGRKKCHEFGVGGMIRELQSMIPANGAGGFVAGAIVDVKLLKAACRLCGKCRDMSEE